MPRAFTVRAGRLAMVLGLLLMATRSVPAASPKPSGALLSHKAFHRPDLYISVSHASLESLAGQLGNAGAWETFLARAAGEKGAPAVHVFVDPRSGVVSNLIGAFPLIPGPGTGNRLGTAMGTEGVTAGQVQQATLEFVEKHRELLGVDPRNVGEIRAVQVTRDLWQLSAPQVVDGIRVRDARLAGTISHGNLVLIGAETWGTVRLDTTAKVTADEAVDKGFVYLDGRILEDEIVRPPALEILPYAPAEHQDGTRFGGAPGQGYGHRLVWTFVFRRPPDAANWEVLVDAHSGEVLALQDLNAYTQQQITGGVYPLTNTEICPDPSRCGMMQSGWPMPFADTGFPGVFTNSAGLYEFTGGTATTTLNGRYVGISDTCGAVSESSSTGSINMSGVNGQHDCASAGSSLGNTASSRSAFYEVNKIAELARGWLPGNTWLQSQLPTNVNIPDICNAYYFDGSINFFRSGGGCRNTGEIAAVLDHEWGHALDDNDANGVLSNSPEGYADIAAIYRLQTSCVGHGFWQSVDWGCGQTSDGTGFNYNENQVDGVHCDTDCSGVRDADWAKHNPAGPDTPLGFVCNECLEDFSGPCGRQVHCAAAPERQAAWDLVARDLPGAPFGFDSETSFVIGNKLFYQGSGNIQEWYGCTCGSSSSGCGAANGYMQWLAADDDNGNLSDGTPHMTAIYNAFNRHGIACSAPAPQNSGCAGGPGKTPVVTATAGNSQVSLTWNAVSGATRYWVFRSEGHAGCNFGKALIAEVAGTAYTDSEVANGRTYYYNVLPVGASSACFSVTSACVSATPVPGPGIRISCNPAALTVPPGGSATSACTIAGVGGFRGQVFLNCVNGLPSGAACTMWPNKGYATFESTMTLTVDATTPPGSYSVLVNGRTHVPGIRDTFTVSLTVPPPDFSVSCSPSFLVMEDGDSRPSTCTVTSTGSFNSPVSLSCTSLSAGSCDFSPVTVTPPPNGTVTSALEVSAAGPQGIYNFQVRGVSGALTRTFPMRLRIFGPRECWVIPCLGEPGK